MTDLLMETTATGFAYTDEDGEALVRRLGPGKLVMLTVREKRNLVWHRTYMALIHFVWERACQDRFPTAENLREAILHRLGYVEQWRTLEGEIHLRVKSMAFDKMKHPEFIAVWNGTLDVITQELIPGCDPDALVNEMKQSLGRRHTA